MADVTSSLSGIVKYFESLPDPRHARNRRHFLLDVIVIAVCGMIVGCVTVHGLGANDGGGCFER